MFARLPKTSYIRLPAVNARKRCNRLTAVNRASACFGQSRSQARPVRHPHHPAPVPIGSLKIAWRIGSAL
jgi:hypothetical protein